MRKRQEGDEMDFVWFDPTGAAISLWQPEAT
jgi:hypothetical protein